MGGFDESLRSIPMGGFDELEARFQRRPYDYVRKLTALYAVNTCNPVVSVELLAFLPWL